MINLLKILMGYLPILVCLANLSFILQLDFQINAKEFGLLMLVPVISLFLGSYTSKLSNKYSFTAIAMNISPIIILFSGSTILLLYTIEYKNIIFLMLLISATYYCSGIIMPNAVANALHSIKIKNGAESSLIGFFQLAGASIFNFLLSSAVSNPLLSIIIVFLISSFILWMLNILSKSLKY